MTRNATRGLLTIGDVAERTGLSQRSIRHYEEQALLPGTERSDGGFRLYTEDSIARLELIMGMKPLGFSLEEMAELLGLLDQTSRDPEQLPDETTAARLRTYRDEVGARTDKLRRHLRSADELRRRLR